MSIPEALLNQMKCCLFDDGHIAIEPIQISCGANACKQCINSINDEIKHCYSCNQTHEKKDIIYTSINKLAESLLQIFLSDVCKYVEKKLESASFAIKGKYFKLFRLYDLINSFKLNRRCIN